MSIQEPWAISSPSCISWLYLDRICTECRFVIHAIQIIMAWLISCVISSSLFTWLTIQLESRKCSIWGRKSKGHHTSGQYRSYPSSVIILIYLATPKQSMFNHTLRKEGQGCEFTLVFHIWDCMGQRAKTKTLFHQFHTQLTKPLTSKHRDLSPFSLFWHLSWKWDSLTQNHM